MALKDFYDFDILEERKPDDPFEAPTLDDYFNTDLVAPSVPKIEPSLFDIPEEELQEQRNAILDFVGQGLWQTADVAAFGIPSLLIPEDIEKEYLTPQTSAGKVAAGIGGFVGYVKGAPLRVGSKVVTAAAKPFIKKMGKPVLKDVIKQSTKDIASRAHHKQFTSKASRKIYEKEIGKRLSYLSQKARWDRAGKGAADNWGKTSSKAIDDILSEAQALKQVTAKEASLISSSFKKNIGTRPMQDFVDIMMERYPNKWGEIVGNIIQEGTVYGLIDAALELPASINQGRDYDPMEYLWGASTGAAFSFLRLLPAAGKMSITSEDFLSGVRSVFSKNHFRNMDKKKLVQNADIIGKTRELNGESTRIKYKDYEIDLRNPISSIGLSDGKSEQILREALNAERVKYGGMMMKEATKEEFKSTLANWKRVLGGTAIMNLRSIAQMSQGQEIPPEDLLSSMLIGAFVNRRGRPLTPEMNFNKMQEIRRNLNVLGEPQYRMYETFPTLGKAQFEFVNPLTDGSFKELTDTALDMGLASKLPEEVESSTKDGSPELPASQKTFPLFNEFYSWLQGASGKRYIKPKALITEAEATKIEDKIREMDFDGVKVDTVNDFTQVMTTATEKITDTMEYEIARTLHKVLNEGTDDIIVNSPSDASLGTIPGRIIINQNLKNKVDNGDSSIDPDAMYNALRKSNKLIEINSNIMKAELTENPNLKIAEIKTEDSLIKVIREVQDGEARINEMFSQGNDRIKFDFNSLDHLQFQLMARYMNKSVDKISTFFSDVDNPNFNEFRQQLLQAGIIKVDPQDPTSGKYNLLDFNNIDITKDDGYKGDAEESLVKSVIGILGAKGNKSFNIDTTTKNVITHEQVNALKTYLESNKVVTQKELLDMFRANITQKIFTDIVKDANINGKDVGILSELSTISPSPMAKYSPLADGGTGFSISKIDLSTMDKRTNAFKAGSRYNDYVDGLLERSSDDKGQSLISEGRTITFTDNSDAKVIGDIVRRKGAKAEQDAQETLIDFVKALDPQDNLRMGLIKYMQKADTPSDLLNFMMSKGFMGTEKKKGIIRYYFDAKKFNNTESREEMKKWISKFGVHVSDINKMINAAEIDLDAITPNDDNNRGTITQQGFFTKYFPDAKGYGSRIQESKDQNELIKTSFFEVDGKLKKDPYKSLISSMEVKVGDKLVTGKDILKDIPQYQDKYDDIVEDVQKMLVLRNGSIEMPVLSVKQGSVTENVKNMQRTPFTNLMETLEIPYVFVDGNMHSFHYVNRSMRAANINVLQMESPHYSAGYNKEAPSIAKNLRDTFYKAIDKYNWEGSEGTHKGVKLIRMGNAKDVIAIPKSSYSQIRDVFRESIFDRYVNKDKVDSPVIGEAKDRITRMMDGLDKATDWTDIHTDAMRSIIVNEMVSSKGDRRFIDVVQGSSADLADIAKRFNLYHTPKFKRLDKDVLLKLKDSLTKPEDTNLLKQFASREVGVLVWNDKGQASIKDRVQQKLKDKATSWEKMLGSRQDETSFDSLSFISKDFKRVLELYYGVGKRGSSVFKPIITSNGESALMFGKTVFVYDPDLQVDLFSKNSSLDILTTTSADKMKSAISQEDYIRLGKPDRPIYIDKTVEDMLKLSGKEVADYLFTMPMDKIGVSVVPETSMLARQSYQIPNFMSSEESSNYYDTFYKNKIDKVIGASENGEGIMGKMLRDSMYKRIALLKMQKLDPSITLEDMQSSPEGLENLGMHLQWAAIGGPVEAMGENVLIDNIKSQFLDPIMSPHSELPTGETYGGKSVIKQSFHFRDLDPTIRKGEKEDTTISPGEIILPYNAREGSISFKNENIKLKAIDKDGKAEDLKDVYKTQMQLMYEKLGDKFDSKEFDSHWMQISDNGALGELHDQIKTLNDELGTDFSIGIMVTRYPRTTPNDLTILRLKDFLSEDHGNTAIVNDFDVLNIFEGDYDFDEVDFFWGMNEGTWSHIDRVKKHWVNTVNPDHYKPSVPDMQLMTLGQNNDDWDQFDANNRMLSAGIGIVQKTIRLVNHVAELGVKNEESGMNDLLRYKKDGDEFTVSVDYDNSSFFERTALESQLIIDYWKGVSKDIINKAPGWRNEYLFPTKDKSIGKEDVESLQQRQGIHLSKGPENNRIRLFRKYNKTTGEEVDLTPEDKTVIKRLMSEHSKLLTLSTEVYDKTGQKRTPNYNDVIDISSNYFGGHLSDITKSAYLAVRRKHGDNEQVQAMFKTGQRERYWTSRNRKKYQDKNDTEKLNQLDAEVYNERNLKSLSGKHTYMWFTRDRGPFLEGVKTNAEQTQLSNGTQGSVVERIYREIYHRNPLANDSQDGKTDVVLQGELYQELEAASYEILSPLEDFGKNPIDRMKSILPKLVKNVNDDIKVIKYYKSIIAKLIRDKSLPQKVKDKRVNALSQIIEEKQNLLKPLLSKKFLDTGQSKYLESLKMVDITRDKDVEEGTIQWYTLHNLADMYKPEGNLSNYFNKISEMRKLAFKYYNEYNSMGSTAPYKNLTLITSEQSKLRQNPDGDMMSIETKLAQELDKGFREHGMAFLFDYAMPTKDDATIGIYQGIPMPVSTKASGRFKRILRFLFDKHNNATNKQEKLEYKEILETLASRYSAYRNFFDRNFDQIPLADQDVMGVINNVPGFSKKLTDTWDRYDTINIEKGTFSKDAFGMGNEYDTHVGFFRNLVEAQFGKNKLSEFKNLEDSLSYTNQLVMQNNYMNPMSYFLMTDNIRTRLSDMGLDKSYTEGLETGENVKPHTLSPELQMLSGTQNGASIKPMALLSEYRINMLKKLIKQGRDMKINQKRSLDWEAEKLKDLKVGC